MSMRSNLEMPGLTLCRRDGELFSLRDFGGRKCASDAFWSSDCVTMCHGIWAQKTVRLQDFLHNGDVVFQWTGIFAWVAAQSFTMPWPQQPFTFDLRLISPSHRLSSPRQMDRNRYGRIFELNPQMAVVERAWCFLLPSAPLNCMELSELLYCSKNCWPIWVQMSMLPRPWHNFEVKITQLGLVFKSCFYDFQIRKHAASFPHTSGIKCEFSQICQQTTKAFVFKPFFGWDWIVFVDVLTCVHTVSSP